MADLDGLYSRTSLMSVPIIAPENGRGDWIRTSDPLLPKQMRYQAAPLPDTLLIKVF